MSSIMLHYFDVKAVAVVSVAVAGAGGSAATATVTAAAFSRLWLLQFETDVIKQRYVE